MRPIQGERAGKDPNRFVQAADDISGNARVDHFAHGPAVEGENRRATGHGLDHDETERFRPVDGKQKSFRIAEKFRFLAFADLADELRIAAEQRLDFPGEIFGVDRIDFRRQLELHAGGARDADRQVRPLLPRHAPEESQVTVCAWQKARAVQCLGNAVIDVRHEAPRRQRLALRHRNGCQRHLPKECEERQKIRKVEPPVHGRQGAVRHFGKDRKMNIVDVKMQQIEFARATPHLLDHRHVVRQGVFHARIEPQCLGRTGRKLGRCDRVGAGEERDVVTCGDEFFTEVGNDPFRAAIEPGRHAFHQGRDLGDFHER